MKPRSSFSCNSSSICCHPPFSHLRFATRDTFRQPLRPRHLNTAFLILLGGQFSESNASHGMTRYDSISSSTHIICKVFSTHRQNRPTYASPQYVLYLPIGPRCSMLTSIPTVSILSRGKMLRTTFPRIDLPVSIIYKSNLV